MANYPALFGGITILGSQATLLDSETTAMVQLTIRTLPTSERVYFGNSDVQSNGTSAHGYIEGGEWHTWGPYTRGGGIRPTQIYLAGTAGTPVLWSAA